MIFPGVVFLSISSWSFFPDLFPKATIKEDVHKDSVLHFLQRLLQKTLRWIPFEVFVHFILSFKPIDVSVLFLNMTAKCPYLYVRMRIH